MVREAVFDFGLVPGLVPGMVVTVSGVTPFTVVPKVAFIPAGTPVALNATVPPKPLMPEVVTV